MIAMVIPVVLAMLCLAMLLNLYRVVRGPTVPDRIVALDTLYINAIALIVVFGIQQDSNVLFEAAMLIAVMGFVGTVAVAKYLLRGDIIE